MSKKYLILAGASQSGTTSFFDSVSKLKIVATGNKKELDYWSLNDKPNKVEYENLFTGGSLNFDSSPSYLRYADKVSSLLRTNFNNEVYIFFVFRDPYERLEASFRKWKNEDSRFSNISYTHFIDIIVGEKYFDYDPVFIDEIRARALVGNYKDNFSFFSNANNSDSLGFIFFQDLVNNYSAVLDQLSKKVGYDLTDCILEKSNENVTIKSKKVHDFLYFFYRYNESFFRRSRAFSFVRGVYKKVNSSGKVNISDDEKAYAKKYLSYEDYKLLRYDFADYYLLKDNSYDL